MKLTFRLSDLYLIEKEKLATALLYAGMLVAFLGSLNPWFMWMIGSLYPIPAAGLVVSAYLVSNTMQAPIFTRNDFLLPMMALVAFCIYECISMESNVNGYIILIFRFSFLYTLFRLSTDRLPKLMTFICKAMALLLVPSLAGHFFYLLGFPLPCGNAVFSEYYSFSNYYLFLVADADIFHIFPRFNSYFLEPSHIGTACAFLLFTQRGQWRKWYNVVLLATIFFTFSVASYVYLVAIMFFNSWTAGKKVARKLTAVIAFLALATIATFTYNGGDNLVHDLIMLRLEIDDGEIAGDNRVTGQFEADYENYVESSDIVFGRKFEVVEFGNAGYRVFYYENGIVGIVLLFAFYFISLMYTPNKRALFAVLSIAALYFWASAFMLWENIYLPLYAAAYLSKTSLADKPQATSQAADEDSQYSVIDLNTADT